MVRRKPAPLCSGIVDSRFVKEIVSRDETKTVDLEFYSKEYSCSGETLNRFVKKSKFCL